MTALWQPGEYLQEFTDVNGERRDNRGNVVGKSRNSNFRPEVELYNDGSGNSLRYGDIFHEHFEKQRERRQKYAYVYPGPYNVHQNQALTDVSVDYEIDKGMFIAPEVSPVKTVQKRSNVYYQFSRGDVTRNYGNLITKAIGANANQASKGYQVASYQTTLYGLRDFIPDRVADNADDALQLMTTTTEFLTEVLDFSWDRRVITQLFNAGTFPSTTFATATAGGAGSIATATAQNRYIQQAFVYAAEQVQLANNGRRPTHFITNVDVAQRISASQEIADQVKYQIGVEYIKNAGFAGDKYGLPNQYNDMKTVVQGVPSNASAQGLTDAFSFLVSNQICFLVVDEPRLKTQNALTTFRFGGLITKTYRDEGREGVWVEVLMDQVESPTNSFGGYILTAC